MLNRIQIRNNAKRIQDLIDALKTLELTNSNNEKQLFQMKKSLEELRNCGTSGNINSQRLENLEKQVVELAALATTYSGNRLESKVREIERTIEHLKRKDS